MINATSWASHDAYKRPRNKECIDNSNDDDDNNDVLAGERGAGVPTANKWEEKKCPRWHQVNYWTRDDDDENGNDDDDDADDWTMTPSIG